MVFPSLLEFSTVCCDPQGQRLWHSQRNRGRCFSGIPLLSVDPVNVGNLISGSSVFSKPSLNIWKFSVHIILKPTCRVLSITILAWASLVAQMVKSLPAVQETRVRPLGWEDPLEKEMATHSSILAWKNPRVRGAWQATVNGVTQSQTQLSDFTFFLSFFTFCSQPTFLVLSAV